jgi:hypothetical protein
MAKARLLAQLLDPYCDKVKIHEINKPVQQTRPAFLRSKSLINSHPINKRVATYIVCTSSKKVLFGGIYDWARGELFFPIV